MKVPYAITLRFKSLEGQDHEIRFLDRRTAEFRAASRDRIDADVAGSLTPEQLTRVESLLSDDSPDVEEGLVVDVDEKTFPLYIVANASIVRQIEGTPADQDLLVGGETDQDESPMCDGGAGRRETLKHLREGLGTIKTLAALPSLIESLCERVAALESAPPPAQAAPAAESEPPAAPTTESVARTDEGDAEEGNTPPGDVSVSSPLIEEGAQPEPQTDAQQETDPSAQAGEAAPSEIELDPEDRSYIAALLRGGPKSAELKL